MTLGDGPKMLPIGVNESSLPRISTLLVPFILVPHDSPKPEMIPD